MGNYLNPGIGRFLEATRSEIFVDKTEMLSCLNAVVQTKQKYVSVSRPRRFGKTMAADMLCAYYGRGTDNRGVFANSKLATTAPVKVGGTPLAWDVYLGAFDVVRITMTGFLRHGKSMEECLNRMQRLVTRELVRTYPHADFFDKDDLCQSMQDIYDCTGIPFAVVVDEWDAPFRERKGDADAQRLYLDFLRNWLKDQEFVALAYLTGILPIKKYGAHSALNMFDEYSMLAPLQLAPYAGFTEDEVYALCGTWGRDFATISDWYDGYEVLGPVPTPPPSLVGKSVEGTTPRKYRLYSPLSVVKAMRTGFIDNYWNQTETYEALAEYIRMDFDGLRRTVALLMDGGRAGVSLSTYQNDMTTFQCADDVLALLVHLGYLGYDQAKGEVFVPNKEVLQVFIDSTAGGEWEEPFYEYQLSKRLLQATWAQDEDTVAQLLEEAHDRADNKRFNSEAALSYAVQFAYYAAHKYYTAILELDSGKGYADVVYLPSPRHPDKPALLVELKWNRDDSTALDQVRSRHYPDRLTHYQGNLLLVGITYDADARPNSKVYKRHRCHIERA